MIAWNQTAGWKNWKVSDFVEWYKGLDAHYGDKKTSDGKYLLKDKAWAIFWVGSEPPAPLNKLSMIVATPSQFKKEMEYLEKNAPFLYTTMGFKDAVAMGRYNPVDKAAQIVKGGLDVVEGVAGAISSAGKIIRVAIPLALAASLIIGGIWAYKKYAK